MYRLPGLNKIKWVSLLLIAVFTLVAYTLVTRETPPAREERMKIGFIGDSITHGRGKGDNAVDAEVAALGSKYSSVNHGVNGSTTSDWKPGAALFDNALADFKAQNVHVVSIMLGTNDARRDIATPPEVYRKNLEAIIKRLLGTGTVRQVIINYPPYAVPGSSRMVDTNSPRRLESYMSEIDGLFLGNVALRGDTKAFEYFKGRQNELIDGVHPTKTGYTHLGQFWAAAYRRLELAGRLPLLVTTRDIAPYHFFSQPHSVGHGQLIDKLHV